MKWSRRSVCSRWISSGLRTLTVIDDAEHARENDRGRHDRPGQLVLDDPEVYELFATGETIGIFQFESSGMRDYLRKLRPRVVRRPRSP